MGSKAGAEDRRGVSSLRLSSILDRVRDRAETAGNEERLDGGAVCLRLGWQMWPLALDERVKRRV